MSKKYLGDGVFAQKHGDGINLTTENGVSTTNIIYLEPEVWRALVQFQAQSEPVRHAANSELAETAMNELPSYIMTPEAVFAAMSLDSPTPDVADPTPDPAPSFDGGGGGSFDGGGASGDF